MSTPVRKAIYGKLSGDTTLNNLLGAVATGYSKSIYYQQAPQGAAFPFVVFSKQSGTVTEEAFGTPPVGFDEDLWLVKSVTQSDSADVAESIQARVATLLNDGPGITVSGSTLLYLRRQSDVDYSESIDGVVYRHAGSLYRVITD